MIFVCLAGICIGLGVLALMRSGEPKNALLAGIESEKKDMKKSNEEIRTEGLESRLGKNNQMISSFNKTEKTETELKLLQVSGESKS